MIELYLSKVTENSESEQAGKLYARVSYKQAMDIHDMAHHMAEHNTAFSEGLIVGVLTDFVKCTRGGAQHGLLRGLDRGRADRLREVYARDGAQRQHREGGQPRHLQGNGGGQCARHAL